LLAQPDEEALDETTGAYNQNLFGSDIDKYSLPPIVPFLS